MVTPVSGDIEITTEVVPTAALPGITELASQMLVPVGFPLGEAQFGGNGIRVSKMDSGKATACFSLNTVAVKQGWGGFVGVWNGKKWVKLATSITTSSDEAAATTACATITGNGTYAFIQYVTDATLLPTQVCPTMIPYFWERYPDEYTFSIFYPGDHPEFTELVYYEVLSYSPDESVWGEFDDFTPHGLWGSQWSDFVNLYADLEIFDFAVIRVEFPGCTATLTWTSESPVDWYEGGSVE